MTSSPDLIQELKASKPTASVALRAQVRELAAGETAAASSPRRPRFRLPVRRFSLVAVPAAAAFAIAAAGVVGLARSDAPLREATEAGKETTTETFNLDQATPLGAPDTSAVPAIGRVQQISATLTVEVDGSDAVSSAAQEVLAMTQRLGGHVVTSSVATGEEAAGAQITVRVPAAKVQQALVELSALGTIVSQQVRMDDLQESIDAFERRQRSLRNQIAVVQARLAGSLDAETRARLESRLKNLRDELRGARRSEAGLRAQGRMATIQLSVVTSESGAAAPGGSRLERTLDEALNILVWEGVIILAILIVLAPFALVGVGAWLGRRLYRRREEDRLLAT
jgi:hypothetical protein